MVDKSAALGSSEKIVFPVPMKTKKEIAFSFSGLKTAVLWEVKKFRENGLVPPVNDICASFQKAAVESLICKLDLAHEMTGIAKITLSGGVAANSQLRRSLEEFALSRDLEIFIPPVAHCTDNAVMIAAAGYNSYMRGERSDLTLSPSPSLLITSQRNND
jgi:N6-L-threonylcarbamoyladenine synthase